MAQVCPSFAQSTHEAEVDVVPEDDTVVDVGAKVLEPASDDCIPTAPLSIRVSELPEPPQALNMQLTITVVTKGMAGRRVGLFMVIISTNRLFGINKAQ
jgi:hypothetical protein